MEWAAAIEVTSGILSFITFSVEAFNVARAIGERGSTAENVQMSMLTEHLKKAAAKMAKHRDEGAEGGQVSEHVEAILQIAIDSEKHCAKLLELLATLTVTPTEGESSADKLAKRARTIIRNIMKKGEVKDLETAIDKNRSATLLHLQLLLEERQVAIQIELSGLRSQSRAQSENIAEQIEALGTDVSELATQLAAQIAVASSASATAEKDVFRVLDDQLRMAKAMQRSLDALLAKNASPSPEVRILRRLFFDEMYGRKHGVRDAEKATFEWILDEDEEDEEVEEEDESEEVEERARIESDREKKMRSNARHSLLTWLSSGNQVFHISGKAGSGKSTLMKLLADHPRTGSELKFWSGKKHLISAQFFFWRSGIKLQKSLTGFYRTVLFEILSQCPELIRTVFPSAYSHFGRDDHCVEQIYFQPNSVETAFNALIHSTPPSEYCLCLFVDGLDEYVGDDVAEEYGEDGKDHEAHQRLADGLREWATNDGVKVLVSSRPHIEFNNTFSKAQQIHLHDITRRDIFLYGLNTIKRSRNFGGIQQYHRDLCLRVVDNANGVFLWAEFAVRVLVKSIASHATAGPLDEKLKSILDKRLEDMPKSLSKLYKKMLGSLLDSDRKLALKLLRFVTRCPYPPNAISISWLDEWDNPNFPASSGDPHGYDEVDIRKRLADVDYRLDDLTRGLLHSAPNPSLQECGKYEYFSRTLQVYHRTVYDFIENNSEMRDEIQGVDRQFPSIVNGDLRIRLQVAELWFAPDIPTPAPGCDPWILGAGYKDAKMSNELISLFRRALDHHRGSTKPSAFLGVWQHICGKGIWKINCGTMSVDHWAMFLSQEPLALLADGERPQSRGEWGAGDDDGVKDGNPGSLSLLLSAAVAGRHAMVRALLQLGHSPEQKVFIRKESGRDAEYWPATVWMIYYVMFANAGAGISPPGWLFEDKETHCLVLEELLATGQVDADYHILLHPRRQDGDDGMDHTPTKPTHIISLGPLVTHLKPSNLPRLLELIAERRDGVSQLSFLPDKILSALKYFAPMVSGTAASQPGTSFCKEDYVPFEFDSDDKHELLFNSLQCGNNELRLLTTTSDDSDNPLLVRLY